MSTPELSRDEVAAALAARKELGSDYEPAVIDGLADRIEQVVQRRVVAKLGEQVAGHANAAKVAGWSLLAGIPITGIVADKGVVSLFVAWGGIAAVNLAHALANRRPRR